MSCSKTVPSADTLSGAPDLLRDILQKDISIRLQVTGRSMVPFIRSGEVVTIVKTDFFQVGDLILYTAFPNRMILHRIIQIKVNDAGINIYRTTGDAVTGYDSPTTEDAILGKVVGIEKQTPFLRFNYICMTSPFWQWISRLIVFRMQVRNHPTFRWIRPIINPQIVTLYRTLRARLTA